MNRSTTTALAFVLTTGASQAHGLSFDDAATGVHTGDGSGDLVLALVAGNDSLVWDLSGDIPGFAGRSDLNFTDILTLSEAGASFSIGNAAVTDFLTPERRALVKWQVFGVANVGTLGDFLNTGDVPTNVGVVLTVDGAVTPILGGDLGSQVQSNAQWLSDNVFAGLTDNGVLLATAGTPQAFYSSVATHGEEIALQDATADGLDLTLAFYYLQKDPSRPNEPPLLEEPQLPGANALPALVRELGSFRLASDGTLSFTSAAAPVPVPAAAWLFGSGAIALAGLARRRRV
jgi:hypothetical protein